MRQSIHQRADADTTGESGKAITVRTMTAHSVSWLAGERLRRDHHPRNGADARADHMPFHSLSCLPLRLPWACATFGTITVATSTKRQSLMTERFRILVSS